jgi:hypothetical protein
MTRIHLPRPTTWTRIRSRRLRAHLSWYHGAVPAQRSKESR